MDIMCAFCGGAVPQPMDGSIQLVCASCTKEAEEKTGRTAEPTSRACECGAEKANTSHAFWCPKHESNQP